MTHHNATFVAVATDGSSLFFGLSENGETAVGNYDTRLDAVTNMLRHETKSSFAAERPLIVVIGKNKTRATAGEKFLEDFARFVVRDTIASLPESNLVRIAGKLVSVPSEYYTPRVTSRYLPWEHRTPASVSRVRALLQELSTTEVGLDLVPLRKTYVGM